MAARIAYGTGTDNVKALKFNLPLSEEIVDPTTVEGFRASLGSLEVYDKAKNFQNTFISYSIANIDTYNNYKCSYFARHGSMSGITSANQYYMCNGGTWPTKYNKLRYPYPTDMASLVADDFPMKFTFTQFDKDENGFWNSLYETMSTTDITDAYWAPSLFSHSNVPKMKLVFNPTHGTDNGTTSVVKSNAVLDSCFDGCTALTEATLVRKGDANTFNTLANVFRGCNHLTNLQFQSLQSDGTASTEKWRVGELAGTFEWCGALQNWPTNFVISNTQSAGNLAPDTVANINYAFEGSGFQAIGSAEEFKVGNAAQAFNMAAATTVNCTLDMRYVHPENYIQTYLLFGDNSKITNIQLKNINHNSWSFDGVDRENMQHIGNCKKFDQPSVEYLFYNLYDLTSNALDANQLKRRNTAPQFNSWTAGGSGVSKTNTTATFSASNGTLTASNVNGTFFKCNINGMNSGEQFTITDGTTTRTITTNGNYYIDITGNTCTITADVINASHSVTVTYLTTWDGAVGPVTAASLYCPAEWDDQTNNRIIDNEMVRIATQRGWMVYVNNVLKPYVPQTTYKLEVLSAEDNVGPVGSVSLSAIYKEIYDGETQVETPVNPTWSYEGVLPSGLSVAFNGNTMTVNNNTKEVPLQVKVIGTYNGPHGVVTGYTFIDINPAISSYSMTLALQNKTLVSGVYIMESTETAQTVSELTEYRNGTFFSSSTLNPRDITWRSSHSNAAIVNESGEVIGRNTGTTRLSSIITATYTIEDTIMSPNIAVSVKPRDSVFEILIAPSRNSSQSNPLSPKGSVQLTPYLIEYYDGVEQSRTNITNQVDDNDWEFVPEAGIRDFAINYNVKPIEISYNNVLSSLAEISVSVSYTDSEYKRYRGNTTIYVSPAVISYSLELKETYDRDNFECNATGRLESVLYKFVNDEYESTVSTITNNQWSVRNDGSRNVVKLNNSYYQVTAVNPSMNFNNTATTDATVTIDASYTGSLTDYTEVSSSISFNVKGVVYTLMVSGATLAIPYHQTASFSPYFLGSNGSILPVSPSEQGISWTLLNAQSKATISNSGVVTNNNNGSDFISATVRVSYSGQTASVPITLNKINYEVYVEPSVISHAIATTSAVTVTGVNQGWTFDNNGYTDITASVTTGGTGDTTVTLTWTNLHNNRTVYFRGRTNTSTIAPLVIAQGTGHIFEDLDVHYIGGADVITLGQSDTAQLEAIFTFTNSISEDLIEIDVTNSATWVVSNVDIASVNSNGLVTALQPGTVTIYGYYGKSTDSATLNVTPAPTLTVSTAEITGTTSAGNQTVTVMATNQTWSVSVPSEATWVHVSPLSGGEGSTAVGITWDENNTTDEREVVLTFRGSAGTIRTVTLTQAGSNPYSYRLEVTPTAQTINYNANAQYTATLYTYYNGHLQSTDDVTEDCEWKINVENSVATVSDGLVTNTNDTGADVDALVSAKYGIRTVNANVKLVKNPNPSYTLRLVVEADSETPQPISADGIIQVYAKVYQYMNGEYRPGGIDVSRDCDWVTSPNTYGSVGANTGSFTGNNTTTSVQQETVTATYNPLNPHNTYDLEPGYGSDSTVVYIGTGGTNYDLQVSSTGDTVTYEESSVTIIVRGINQGWTASSNKTWLKVDTNSGEAGVQCSVIVSWDANDGPSSRVGTITFTGRQNNQQETFVITQNPIQYHYELEVTSDSGSIMGGEKTQCNAIYKKLNPNNVVVASRDVTTEADWDIYPASNYGSVDAYGEFTGENTGDTIQTVTVRARYEGISGTTDINVSPHVATTKYYLRAEAANGTVAYNGTTTCTLYVDEYFENVFVTAHTIPSIDSIWSISSGDLYGDITAGGNFTAHNYNTTPKTVIVHGQLAIQSEYFDLVELNSAEVSINVQGQPSRTITVTLSTNQFENYTVDTEIEDINCTVDIVDGNNQPVTSITSTYDRVMIYGEGHTYPFDGTTGFTITVPVSDTIILKTSITITFSIVGGGGSQESDTASDVTITAGSTSATIILPEIVYGTK